MSSRPSNSVIVALYLDVSCCVDADDAITGVFHCRWGLKKKKKGMVLYSAVSSPLDRSKRFTLSRKIRRLVAPPRACFKVKIEACKLFAKFVHSPFGRLIHTFITNMTIYYKC